MKKEKETKDSLYFYSIVIPTIDTFRTDVILTHLLKKNVRCMVLGDVGVGKSMTANNIQKNLDTEKFKFTRILLSH